MKRYRLNEKRKKLYLTIGLLALMVVSGYMTTLDLRHLQSIEQLQTAAKPKAVAEIPLLNDTPQAEKMQDFDTPLSEDLQGYIIETAESEGLDPALVLAVIEKESNYDADAIGDGGDSKGLMQIQEKWHYSRIERLGCDNLFDPYGNVKVGVDILSELVEKHGETGGLVAYNQGYFDGQATEYSKEVLRIKSKLNKEDI